MKAKRLPWRMPEPSEKAERRDELPGADGSPFRKAKRQRLAHALLPARWPRPQNRMAYAPEAAICWRQMQGAKTPKAEVKRATRGEGSAWRRKSTVGWRETAKRMLLCDMMRVYRLGLCESKLAIRCRPTSNASRSIRTQSRRWVPATVQSRRIGADISRRKCPALRAARHARHVERCGHPEQQGFGWL